MSPIRPRAGALFVASLCLAFAVPALAVTPNGRLQIIHLDVGQGDGAAIISPLGQVVLIDEGPSGVTTAMGQTVVQQLQALGVTHVDYHFASHYHSDHVGNLAAIKSAGITVGYGWDRGGSYSSSAYTSYANALGSTRRTMVKNQVILLDSLSAHPVVIKCVDLAGAGTSTTDENTLSMVLRVTYGEFDETFGGDLPGANSGSYKDIETTVGPEAGPVEVYKVHHHGSATSSFTNWLNATGPKIGVISLGNGNSYGHPTSAALGRLHSAGVRTYWTETGTGVAPLAGWDKVSNSQVIISATWQPGGVDTVRGNGFADTFTNSGGVGDVVPPSVTVNSPNGGEDWKAGSAHAISWTATDAGGVTSVDLACSTDGGATYPITIAAGIANSGSYAWTVPSSATSGARVRVTARDAAGNAGTDGSDANFTISTWTIAAAAGPGGNISPSGSVAVNHGGGQAFAIATDVGYHVADVLVDGATVGAVTGYTFTNVTANHTISASFAIEAYTIAVTVVGAGSVGKTPEQPAYPQGTNVEVSAAPASGWAFSGWGGDLSGTDNPITVPMLHDVTVTAMFADVAAPTVLVNAPNGRELLFAGNAYTILWTAEDNAAVDSVDVDYSISGPEGPWMSIARGLPNSGSFEWTVPEQVSDSALVRVTAFDHALNAGSDTSDGLLSIAIRSLAAGGERPRLLSLARPAPNPSHGDALFSFSLPAAGVARLELLDVSGRRIWGTDGFFPAGTGSFRWRRLDARGGRVDAGLYFVRLITPWGMRTERLVLLR